MGVFTQQHLFPHFPHSFHLSYFPRICGDLYRTSGLFLCVVSIVNCSVSGKLDGLFYLSLPNVFYFTVTSTEFQNGLFYIGIVCQLLVGCIHLNTIAVHE